MRHQRSKWIHGLLCVAMLMALLSVPSALAQDEATNLLENGGFEGEYVAIGGDPTLSIAPNWQPWSLGAPDDADSSAINQEPDYQPAPANRVLSGSAAQEYNTFFATHDGGLFQRVPVEVGAILEFTANIYVWSSATFENPDESIEPQDVDVQVGIDPTGGQDGGAETVVWSEPQRYYDEYRALSISATAETNAVTVFIRSTPQGSTGVNNIYVDDASLIQTGVLAPEPEPTEEVLEPEPTEEATAEATEAPDTGNDTTGNATGNNTTGTGTTGNNTGTGTTGNNTGTGTTGNNTAAATATPTPNPAITPNLPNRLTYVVRGGDTLFSIATLNRSTVEAVLAANGLTNANLIFVGQQLVIPVPANTPNSTPASGATSTPTGGSNATPNPNATATTVPVQGQGTYVVQAGEGLYSIAVRFNTTVEALAALNNITNPNQIRAGTILRVPAVTTPTTGNPGTGGPTTPPSTHTVRAGENLFRIGLQYNVTVDALALANRLTNANVIYAGQVLVIPR